MRKILSIVFVATIFILNFNTFSFNASEFDNLPTLTELEVEELISKESLPDEYILIPRTKCYYQCTYYKYTTISMTSRVNNVFLRDHPSWGWKYDTTNRSLCTGKFTSSISTNLSIGGKIFSVGVSYAPSGTGTFDCVNSVNKAGKTKVRPTIVGDKYILKQKVEKINSQTGKILSTGAKTSGVTVNEQLGLRYA